MEKLIDRLVALGLLALLVFGLLLGCAKSVRAEAAAAQSPDLEPLTPVGAERAGNAAGTIPAWDGGLHAGNRPVETLQTSRPPDPYPDDKPLFEITADNYMLHADKLSEGHQRLFQQYPGYRMPVFVSRRSAAFPEGIYAATRANTATAKLEGTDSLQGAKRGFPFPQPKSGAEVIWNHKLKYRTEGVARYNNEAVVHEDGKYQLDRRYEVAKFVYGNLAEPVTVETKLGAYLETTVLEPRQHAGSVILVHEPIDLLATPRLAWTYNPGQRRTHRAPNLAYDDPMPGSDGMQTMDQIDMFVGLLDRYDWKLLGKRELYIPYNSYRLLDQKLKYKDILTPHFINPAYTRYELHRVWVVEATVKPGLRHMFARRVFYVDEDSWTIAAVDLYDLRGELWRFQEGHIVQFYRLPITTTIPEIIYDFSARRYFATLLTNEDEFYHRERELKETDFTSNAMKRFAPPSN